MNPYFDPTYSSAPPSWSLPEGSAPTWKPDPGTTFSWADQDEKDSPFDIFKNTLSEGIGSYTKRFAGVGDKREGDTYIKPPGATVADLGGGNTLFVPDTTAQLRMAQAGQQGSGGGIGRMAGQALGGSIGSALGTSMIASAGGAAAAGLGTTIGAAALGPIGAIGGAMLGGLLPF
jgi:hypothetical protein